MESTTTCKVERSSSDGGKYLKGDYGGVYNKFTNPCYYVRNKNVQITLVDRGGGEFVKCHTCSYKFIWNK